CGVPFGQTREKICQAQSVSRTSRHGNEPDDRDSHHACTTRCGESVPPTGGTWFCTRAQRVDDVEPHRSCGSGARTRRRYAAADPGEVQGECGITRSVLTKGRGSAHEPVQCTTEPGQKLAGET